jgi:hypothetical protein
MRLRDSYNNYTRTCVCLAVRCSCVSCRWLALGRYAVAIGYLECGTLVLRSRTAPETQGRPVGFCGDESALFGPAPENGRPHLSCTVHLASFCAYLCHVFLCVRFFFLCCHIAFVRVTAWGPRNWLSAYLHFCLNTFHISRLCSTVRMAVPISNKS